MKIKLKCIYFAGVLGVFVGVATPCWGTSVLQLSIMPEVQLIAPDESVCGLRLNLPYGVNESVTGIDLGFFSQTSKDAAALQISVFGNIVEQNADGIQIATVNAVGNAMTGFQIGLLYNTANKFKGLSISGGANYYVEEGEGIMIAVLGNYAPVLKGLQVGLVNAPAYATGLQIGLVNWTKNMRGLQIGIINYIEEGALPFMLGLNANF